MIQGRHFLQFRTHQRPDRVLRAMDRAVIDHRGPEFAELGREVLDGRASCFRPPGRLLCSGFRYRRWEAAIVNTLSAGDRVLMFETGHFSSLWKQVAERMGVRWNTSPELAARPCLKMLSPV